MLTHKQMRAKVEAEIRVVHTNIRKAEEGGLLRSADMERLDLQRLKWCLQEVLKP